MNKNTSLSHIDNKGRAQMVDIEPKPETQRVAVAIAEVHMNQNTLNLIRSGDTKKGDVYTVAKIAGIQASKRTANLIPLCHPLLLTHVDVEMSDSELLGDGNQHGVTITATVRSTGKTGVEMEALVAVTTAALTIYDMTKSVEKSILITNVRLVEKRGGQSGDVLNR
jgi:cyclic pyranopterin phosphate synthase